MTKEPKTDFIYNFDEAKDLRADMLTCRQAGLPVSERELSDGTIFLHVPHGFAAEAIHVLARPRVLEPERVFDLFNSSW